MQRNRSARCAIWWLIVFGTYRSAERIFLLACLVYFAYPISAFLAKPDWAAALVGTVTPSLPVDLPGIAMVVGIVGTVLAFALFLCMRYLSDGLHFTLPSMLLSFAMAGQINQIVGNLLSSIPGLTATGGAQAGGMGGGMAGLAGGMLNVQA